MHLARKGWDVWFGTQRKNSSLEGLKVFNYEPHRKPDEKTHPYSIGFESAVLNGQAVARSALKMKDRGLDPDIVVAHSGWGPGMFAKDIWPNAKFVGYFEWYYWPDSPDVLYFGTLGRTLDDALRGRARNATILMDLANCDAGICPTQFQFDQFPECFQPKLHILHDGVDTQTYCAKKSGELKIGDVNIAGDEEVVTYVARGMEPYRGFPEFMKAAEIIQKKRKGTHFIIVGEDRVAYGKKLGKDDSYKKRALETLDLDLSRTHFTGLIPRNQYLQVLQRSNVHVYLTAPFVLSWSMMEAMSVECAIVASDNEPVRELIDNDVHGLLAETKKSEEIADRVIELLDDKDKRARLGAAARARIVEKYDVQDLYEKREKLFQSLVFK
jgi:glycosyltransferase involved in cell wall biosynthesis